MEEKIIIQSDVEISAVLHRGFRNSVVIALHGFESFKDSPKYVNMAEEFSNSGFSFIRFDFRGCGETPGDKYDLEGRIKDTIAVYQWVKKSFDKVYFVGSSLGGTIAILLGNLANGIVALCPPPMDIGKYKIKKALEKNPPILIIHGNKDETVPIEDGKKIYDMAQPPKEFYEVDGGDHRFSDPLHLAKVIEKTLSFIKELDEKNKG